MKKVGLRKQQAQMMNDETFDTWKLTEKHLEHELETPDTSLFVAWSGTLLDLKRSKGPFALFWKGFAETSIEDSTQKFCLL